jgi:NADH-quinone oxidoreductase subunit A
MGQNPWVFVFIYTVCAIGFALLPIVLAKVLAPKKPGQNKQEPYECGVRPSGDSWIQFKSQYYIYALAFLVFDVEIAFLYPWAIAFQRVGWLALIEVVLFLVILGGALFYAWKKQDLKWE